MFTFNDWKSDLERRREAKRLAAELELDRQIAAYREWLGEHACEHPNPALMRIDEYCRCRVCGHVYREIA